MAVVRLAAVPHWKALHFGSYLSEGLDSLGLERLYENGVTDTAENVERLNDYPDYHKHPEDDLGPEYAEPAPPLRHRERGSHHCGEILEKLGGRRVGRRH